MRHADDFLHDRGVGIASGGILDGLHGCAQVELLVGVAGEAQPNLAPDRVGAASVTLPLIGAIEHEVANGVVGIELSGFPVLQDGLIVAVLCHEDGAKGEAEGSVLRIAGDGIGVRARGAGHVVVVEGTRSRRE